MVFQRSNLVTASLHVDLVAAGWQETKKSDKLLMSHYAFANKECY